jgi:hypothetical protein
MSLHYKAAGAADADRQAAADSGRSARNNPAAVLREIVAVLAGGLGLAVAINLLLLWLGIGAG